MEKLKHIIATLLLVALSFSFFPLDSLHHHQGEQIICNNTNTHFDEHAVACDLCDFLLQEYLPQQSNSQLIQQVQYSEFIEEHIPHTVRDYYQIPLHRGPPFMV